MIKLKSISLLIIVFIIAIAVVTVLWPFIQLPLKNPYNITSWLTLRGFNPTNMPIRYFLYILFPSIALLGMYRYSEKFKKHLNNLFDSIKPKYVSEGNRTVYIISVVILFVWGFVEFVEFFTWDFIPTPMDFFHEGEKITPAFQYMKTGTISESSYFIHGYINDVFHALWSFEIFGKVSVGSYRFMSDFFQKVIYLVAPFFIFVLSKAVNRKEHHYTSLLISIMMVVWILSNDSMIFTQRRDTIFLISLIPLIITTISGSRFISFMAGLGASLCLVYSLDIGLFYGLLLLIWVGLTYKQYKRERIQTIVTAILGTILGYMFLIIVLGPSEIINYAIENYRMLSSGYLMGGTIYPVPGVNIFSFTVLPIFCLSLMIFLYSLHRIYLKRKNIKTDLIVYDLFISLAVIWYTITFTTSDIEHVQRASLFIVLLLALFIFVIFKSTISKQRTISILILILLFISMGRVVYMMSHIKLARLLDTPNRVKSFIMADDDMFLTKSQNIAVNRMREIFKDEECFFSLTSEGALPYLLRLKSCTRYFMLYKSVMDPRRDQILKDLKQKRPQYILYKSRFFAANHLAIPNNYKYPKLYEYIEENYSPYEIIEENWQIYKRN